MSYFKSDATIIGPYPTLVGEIGIPFDLDNRRAYGYTDNGKHKGDFRQQQKALDASLNGCDGENGINYTVWNYCPENSHEWGDGWNMEDLSLWSPDDVPSAAQSLGVLAPALRHRESEMTLSGSLGRSSITTPSGPTRFFPNLFKGAEQSPAELYNFLKNGSRAIRAFCRPCPLATVGRPSFIDFNIHKAEFKLKVVVKPGDGGRGRASQGDRDAEKLEELATEIFVPLVHFAHPSVLEGASLGNAGGGPENTDAELAGISASEPPTPITDTDAPLITKQASSTSSEGGPKYAGRVGYGSTETERWMDLSVDASAGRWVLSRQVLRWYYPIPDDEEGPAEYSISIRRAAGPIPGFMGSTAPEPLSEGYDAGDEQTLCEQVGAMFDQCTIA